MGSNEGFAAVAGGVDLNDVPLCHMVGNDPFACHVILNELVPANAGSVFLSPADANDVDSIPVRFSPTGLNPFDSHCGATPVFLEVTTDTPLAFGSTGKCKMAVLSNGGAE